MLCCLFQICIKCLSQSNFISPMMKAMKRRCDLVGVACEALNNCFHHSSDDLMQQVTNIFITLSLVTLIILFRCQPHQDAHQLVKYKFTLHSKRTVFSSIYCRFLWVEIALCYLNMHLLFNLIIFNQIIVQVIIQPQSSINLHCILKALFFLVTMTDSLQMEMAHCYHQRASFI